MAATVSPARRPAALPAAKTSATTFGPESYMVRQPKSGLFRQRAMLTPYAVNIAPVRATAAAKRSQWRGTVRGSARVMARPRLRAGGAAGQARPQGPQDEEGGRGR